MQIKRILTVIIALIFVPLGLFAFSLDGIQINSTTYFVFSEEPIENSPSPGLITQGFGVSVPMSINSFFYIEPGLSLYNSIVILDEDNRVVLANIETANRINLLHLEIRPEVGLSFRIADTIKLGFSITPQISIKIPVAAHDYEDGSEAKALVWDYCMTKGRFFSISGAGVFKWEATETISFVFKAGIDIPIHNLWDTEDSSIGLQPGIGFIFRL